MAPPRLPAVLLILLGLLVSGDGGSEILSKYGVVKCVRDSGTGGNLTCTKKIFVDVAVPSGASGGEASLVARIDGVEGNPTAEPTIIRSPPVITINKSAVYKVFALTYLRDVPSKAEELSIATHKCEPDAGADIVGACERLWNNATDSVIEYTEPVCCPCGKHSMRAKTPCEGAIGELINGKSNTAHCVRFPGEWFHVFKIGQKSLGFTIRVQVKNGSSVSEVTVGPDNKTAVSGDSFLRASVIGDYAAYKSTPTFDSTYLVTPRKGEVSGQPEAIGNEYSKWMLLENKLFTQMDSTDTTECDKIGVGYRDFQTQADFCNRPMNNCLNNQLWTFMEEDKDRKSKNEKPRYVVEGRFERINQHPNASVYSFSVGITKDLKTSLLIEINADDIEYDYQWSPREIIGFKVHAFESLSAVGVANVTTKNTGELEASYSLTLKCLSGIADVLEQSYVMKPDEATSRSFDLLTSTDKAENYTCTAILKTANFSEADRANCTFSTTATVFKTGTQVGQPIEDSKEGGIWDRVVAFFTGRLCSSNKCSSLFDFRCQFQNMCIGWMIVLSVLFLATVAMLHETGLFHHLYDWCKDLVGVDPHDGAHMRHGRGGHHRHHHHHHHHRSGPSHHHHPHHRVIHRHDEQTDAAEGGRRHRHHEVFLGVQHRNKHKQRRGKEMAALHLDGPSGLYGTDDRERRHHKRHGHGQHGEHHHLRSD